MQPIYDFGFKHSNNKALPAPPPEEVPGAPTPPVVGPGGGEGGGKGPGGGIGTLGPGPSPGAAVDKEMQQKCWQGETSSLQATYIFSSRFN